MFTTKKSNELPNIVTYRDDKIIAPVFNAYVSAAQSDPPNDIISGNTESGSEALSPLFVVLGVALVLFPLILLLSLLRRKRRKRKVRQEKS